MDLDRIDLSTLDNDELERIAMILNLTKIQQDIAKTQQDIAKTQQTLEQDRERWILEQKRLELEREQMRLSQEKLQKELKWYPWLPLLTAMITGGAVVFLLTQLLQK